MLKNENKQNQILEIKIDKIHCVNCVNTIKSKLKKFENKIDFFNIDINSSKLFLSLKDYSALNEIKNEIEKLGYKFILESYDQKVQEVPVNENIDNKNILKDKEFLFLLFISFLAFIVFIVSMFFHNFLIYNKSLLYLVFVLSSIVYFVGGYRFLRNSFFAIKNKVLNMDVLITLSTTSAYLYSLYNLINNTHIYYFETSSVIIAVILIGKYIEQKLKTTKIANITNLLRYKPKKALVVKDKEIKEIDVNDIRKDDILEIRKGEFVPVDGVIIEGQSTIDLNFIYGEVNQIKVGINDKISSGALILDGNIKIIATTDYQQSFWNSLEYLIKNISQKESNYLSLVDKISGNFVIIVFSLAVLSYLVWNFIFNDFQMAFKSFISTLIIACPCAIGLAYPLAVNKGVIESIKKQILVKDISTFEKIVKSNIFIFDKTGTITSNEFLIKDIKFDKTLFDKNLMDNFVEQALFVSTYKSTHPLSKSLHLFLQNNYNFSLYKLIKKHKIISFDEVISKGIIFKAEINTNIDNNQERIKYELFLGNKEFIIDKIKDLNINGLKENFEIIINKINAFDKIKNKTNDLKIYFVINFINDRSVSDICIGVIYYEEKILDKVFELLEFLKNNSKEIYVLTGASKESAISLANKLNLNLNNIYFEVSSVKKYEILTELKSKGTVTFIGDGINDSICIKEADVGISFEYGNDLSQNLADVILKNIEHLKEFYLISLKTFKKLKFNLFWVFFYNILLIPVAMGAFYKFGIFVNPMFAAVAMALSSISLLLFNIF